MTSDNILRKKNDKSKVFISVFYPKEKYSIMCISIKQLSTHTECGEGKGAKQGYVLFLWFETHQR